VYDFEHWHKEWQDVKDDIQGRAGKLIAELKSANMYPSVQPPQFIDGSQIIKNDLIYVNAGFQLTIQRVGTSGTIYYTTDGNDSRSWDLSGDAIPEAKQITTQSEDITINNTTVIKARCKSGNVWSPLHELTIVQGSATNTIINERNDNAATVFLLYQNYPNPFNSTTEIAFSISKKMHINLKVYNGQGQNVETLVDEKLAAGSYSFSFIAQNLPAGIYYYILQSGNEIQTRKMVLMK